MTNSRRRAALAFLCLVTFCAPPVSAEERDLPYPDGGLQAACTAAGGDYYEDAAGESCYTSGGYVQCQWGNPICQGDNPARVGNIGLDGILAMPPKAGPVLAPSDTPPPSLSSGSSGTVTPSTNCQLNPKCG